jgi:hypothetical protein
MRNLLLVAVSIGLLGTGLISNARADAWNKKTVLRVNETIQVPNKVLPPGKYVIRLLNSPVNRNVVQIFNGDETELQTTILAIPNYRLQPTDKTVFTFWEMPAGQPKALRAWFYPGDNFGHEFAYPKTKAVTIAAATHAEVLVTEAEKSAELTTAPVERVTEQGKEEPVVEAQPPAPAPVAPAATTEAKPAPAPKPELPKTASPYPFIGLAGLVSLAVFAVLRTIRAS